MRKLSLILVLALAACGTSTAPVSSTRATVSAAQASLAAAGKVVLACYSVPACNAAPAVAKVKPQIKAAYDTAYNAVVTAQSVADAGGSPDLTAATASLAVLQGLITQLPPAAP